MLPESPRKNCVPLCSLMAAAWLATRVVAAERAEELQAEKAGGSGRGELAPTDRMVVAVFVRCFAELSVFASSAACRKVHECSV